MANSSKIRIDEDTGLMLKVARGDYLSYEKLYRKYCLIVTDYIVSCNGDVNSRDDLVQQVFLHIWQNRKEFRGRSSTKTYIFGIAKNVLREHHRQCQRQIIARSLLGPASDSVGSDTDAERHELADAIKLAKSKLSAKERQALELTLYGGISLVEAARLAGCSYQAFRRRVYEAKKRLSALLEHLHVC